ncbi:type IV conjugative transfer system lipoprotein TraV [Pseudomonas sp. GOM6]|uniref:type IV conjugative transfer system lipoprotein TraV n=1 Tax=Pseudomonas sp. GOM6 TaxID=3036944 RepID=UPI002409E52D|nr:type IV conjugative transfer system lipoprotein TraV [Pseudomonas sp. GOM6]MDG1580856.1 type IV conjugative transfer system lipoprotein TraV [Pseudomonas sp. GOM6]
MNKASMIKKSILFAGLAVVLSQVTGCSFLQIGESEYGCKGMPNGVTCMSARDVYQMTESENFRQRMEQDAKLNQAKAEGDEDAVEALEASSKPVMASGEHYVVPRPARNPVPIRTQATVMRVWVAPWESEAGDLNVPGYIYTEIEPRRWEIGTPAMKPTPTIRPLTQSKTETN